MCLYVGIVLMIVNYDQACANAAHARDTSRYVTWANNQDLSKLICGVN